MKKVVFRFVANFGLIFLSLLSFAQQAPKRAQSKVESGDNHYKQF